MDIKELVSWGTAHFTPETRAEAREQNLQFLSNTVFPFGVI
jgi:hypothetical protein